MRINKLKLNNFRYFEHYELNLADRFNLLIGDNGSGKTAILDALSSVLSEFIKGFPDIDKSNFHIISKQDKRYVLLELGQTQIKQSPYDILLIESSISINGNIEICTISDFMNYENPHLAIDYAKNIMQQDTFLPLIAYYATDRLWKKATYNEIKTLPPDSRLLGYKNCLQTGANLEQIFSWFKTQELAALQKKQRRHVLEAVREAIIKMIPNSKNVFWDMDWDELVIESEIQGQLQSMPFRLLSDGYRNMIGMVADIAYRMATLNPQLEKDVIKQTEGIVLIDEIDLHLHPKWQTIVVDRLLHTFPKVQFVATTHSPFIIQSLHKKEGCLLWDLERNQPLEINSKSIEDIAEDQQGVEIPQQSRRFLEMEKSAEEYYRVLKQIPPAPEEEKQKLKQKLDELLFPYSDDPAYQAFLKIKRLAVEENNEK